MPSIWKRLSYIAPWTRASDWVGRVKFTVVDLGVFPSRLNQYKMSKPVYNQFYYPTAIAKKRFKNV